tara:strand:+ start:32553 stop:33800 length:1248 start_codon:yes stop_codon:yes gene_type:complete
MANAANQFTSDEVNLFEMVLEKFDSDNTVAMEAAMFSQPGQAMQRRGDTVWRPQPMISTTVSGLDISSAIASVHELVVPASLDTIENVTWQLDAQSLRDPSYRERKARSGAQALSAVVNRAIANNVALWGSLTVDVTAALSGYANVALADALMVENDVLGAEKTMVLNARDYNNMAGDLASRTLMSRSERALSDTELGPIASFNTFKTSFTPAVTAQAAATTVAGANQDYDPVSETGGVFVDNRTQVLNVTSGTGIVAGDKFTIADVFAVSHINKNNTQQLKTFTVIEVNTNALTISPPIIVGPGSTPPTVNDDYANCDSIPANLAALVFLNTTAATSNLFFMNDSIEIFSGSLAFNEDMAGVAVMRSSTDTGLEVIFAKQGDVKTGIATYRMTIFFGVTNLNPEMNGILIGGQV